jgi:uncharacterized membrane protein YkoI
MKRIFLVAALMAGMSLGLSPAGVVAAQDRHDEETARAAVRSGSQVPLSSVLAMLAKRHPGRQLNTTMGESGGRPVYNVQWQLTNGQIVVFVVDAKTGQEIG